MAYFLDRYRGEELYVLHPVGRHWPKEPPNYIAFRYRGKLQWIHHIESAEVFTDPHSKFPGIPDRKWEPHFLYCLGPKLAPSHDVPMGKLYPNGRNRCWTFNFAHPLAWLIVALIVLIPAGIAIVATKMAGK